MAITYESVKEHMLRYHRNNAHRSRHNFKDPNHLAVVAMGAKAAPHLFRLMQDHYQEACHFGYNILPLLIDPPEHIKNRMNEEAFKGVGGFVGLDVRKMEEIYHQWGVEIGAIS